MRVKEVADLVGISVRTLHHYDEIGLLSPGQTTAAGYRLYSDRDLETLQQILFFRELDFPLKRIKEIIGSPTFDRREALELHRRMLVEKRLRIDQMIGTIDKTILHAEGEIHMSSKEKFEGFDFRHHPYEQEARERWGDNAVDESNARVGAMSEEQQNSFGEGMSALYRKLGELRHSPPESDEAQAAIGEWFEMLQTFGAYSMEAFKDLGQMYVDDERFTKNIDKFGEGLSRFMRDAMALYADKRS